MNDNVYAAKANGREFFHGMKKARIPFRAEPMTMIPAKMDCLCEKII